MVGFKCLNCGRFVSEKKFIGTVHRNHCPFCLWSKHVDEFCEGDRKATCLGTMEPIGLTFKKVKPDKYKPNKKGEIMIIHRCTACGKVSFNRVAADDKAEEILKLLEKSKDLKEEDRREVKIQLFGKDR